MKKVRFLVLTLVVAMMLMGAGYAAWTDKLNIQEVVVESGILDVDFINYSEGAEVSVTTNEPARAVPVMTATGDIQSWTGDGFTPEIDGTDADKVRININNMYPGGVVTANFTMKNVGTIPVKVSQVLIERTAAGPDLGELLQYMDINATIGANAISDIKTVASPQGAAWFLGSDAEIAVGEEIDCQLVFALRTDAPNETTEDKTFTLTIHPFFKQFNL